MNITLHIERFILDGIEVAPHERPALQAAVEAELTSLLAAGGVAPDLMHGGALSSVRAGTIEGPSEGASAQLGRQIARAVYGGIGR